ncbi:THAP domain-containing protein 3-like [Harpegnathos saltator]|uniref:THAP domain-containing protein 3-like n=1 Tax=Harpegnathos saltator TaxID=610380 RepID=UPI000DBEEEB8|nr:THAP domain-containing protein 3-like [Harpegnathos saltator]
MVWKCCVLQCKSTSQIPVHRFPEDASKREHWLIAIGKTDLIGAPKETLAKLRICMEHFPKNIVQSYGSRRRLTNNAVPILHLPFNFEQHVDINVNDNICEHVSVVENVPNDSAFMPLPMNMGEEAARKNEEEEGIYVLKRNLRTQRKMLHNKKRIIYH